jgi:hypothetical protein
VRRRKDAAREARLAQEQGESPQTNTQASMTANSEAGDAAREVRLAQEQGESPQTNTQAPTTANSEAGDAGQG